MLMDSSIKATTVLKSSSLKPLLVKAGAPEKNKRKSDSQLNKIKVATPKKKVKRIYRLTHSKYNTKLMYFEAEFPQFLRKAFPRNRQVKRRRKLNTPRRRPLGFSALLSPGQVFLFAVMEQSSIMRSALAPSVLGLRSTKTRWLSVPPERQKNLIKLV